MQHTTVGLVGAGGIARAHLPAWLSLGVDVVVHSEDDQAPALVRDAGGGRVVDGLQQLLAEADVVDVCTPTPTHRALVEAAAAAGRHVVCEKPLGRTAEDAAVMVAACARAGVRLLPAHVVRFFPEYALLRERVLAGDVGQVAVQRFTRIGSRPVRAWFHDPEQSGGIIVDQMIHDLDIARWLAGEVTSVFARQSTGGPDSSTAAQVTMTHADGAISTAFGGWAAPGTRFRTSFMVAGTGGYLEHDSDTRSPLRTDVPQVGTAPGALLPGPAFLESPFRTELRELLAAVTTGAPSRVSAQDGLVAVALAEAAARSVRDGTAVDVHLPAPTGVAA